MEANYVVLRIVVKGQIFIIVPLPGDTTSDHSLTKHLLYGRNRLSDRLMYLCSIFKSYASMAEV